MIFNPNLYLTVFLSYDEPNSDANYRHLLTVNPRAQRIHGIKGSNTAHRRVGELANNLGYDRVIVVDGDVSVNQDFYEQTIDLRNDLDWNSFVISWSGLNSLNGTSYGNGGIKSWPTTRLLNQQTHENSVDGNRIDFDFNSYLQLNRVGGTVNIVESALQALRAGFREGTKLCLNGGRVTCGIGELDWRNYDRLWMWMHVGMNHPNGIWAIYGARQAAYLTLNGLHDYNLIHDFDYLYNMFKEVDYKLPRQLLSDANEFGQLLSDSRIQPVLTAEASKEYRNNYRYPLRSPESFLRNPLPIVYDKFLVEDINTVDSLSVAECATTDYFWIAEHDADISFVPEFYAPAKTYEFPGARLVPRITTLRTSYEN